MSEQVAELVLLSSGELIHQGEASNRISLVRTVTSIGRDGRQADVVVQNIDSQGESYISGMHCTIYYEARENSYYILDNNSTNGTLLNGKALNSGVPTLLNDTDVIELSMIRRGGAMLRFYTDPPLEFDIKRTEPVTQTGTYREVDPITRPVATGQLSPDVLTMQHTIFVSYSREDTKLMQKMLKVLQGTYYLKLVEFWTDEHLKVGMPSWSRKIEAAIESSHGLIVLLTPNSKHSEWVERELGYAQARGIRIFPALGHKNAAASIPITLIDLQHADLHRDFNLGIQKLIDDIHAHLRQIEDQDTTE